MRKNYNKEIDFALGELLKAYEDHWKAIKDAFGEEAEQTHTKVSNSLKQKFGLKEWEVRIVFDYLEEEKYVKSIEPMIISQKGVVLALNGGITEKLSKENLRKNRQIAETWLLVIGSLSAGVYACFQIYDRMHQCCQCHQ